MRIALNGRIGDGKCHRNFLLNKKGAVALANIFCWAAALLYAQMASKSVTFSMPFFINAVHSQASLSACLISGCFVFNYQNLCPF